MKWTRLKVFLLPAIMQEIDSVTEKYINLINEVRRTNNRETLQEFLDMREDITKRIEELDNFYEDNIGDSKIVNFEKGRIRLKKLLMYDPDLMDKVEMESQNKFRGLSLTNYNDVMNNNQSPVKAPRKTQELSSSKKDQANNLNLKQKFEISSKIARSSLETNSKNKSSLNANSNLNQNTHANVTNRSSYNSNLNTNANLNNNSKINSNKKDLNSEFNLDFTPHKNNNINNSTRDRHNSLNLSNLNNDDWKEIMFKIKLSEAEYKLLLREKSKYVVNI